MIGPSDWQLPWRPRHAAACVALAVALVACAAPYPYGPYYYDLPGPRAQIGAFTGAAAGGLLGSAASGGEGEAIVAGMLLGGLLGGALGDSLDQADRRYAAHSFQQGLEYHPSGRISTWRNPRSGHAGSLTPTRTYETARGYCREFTQTVTIDGSRRRVHGIACRDGNGHWRVEP